MTKNGTGPGARNGPDGFRETRFSGAFFAGSFVGGENYRCFAKRVRTGEEPTISYTPPPGFGRSGAGAVRQAPEAEKCLARRRRFGVESPACDDFHKVPCTAVGGRISSLAGNL